MNPSWDERSEESQEWSASSSGEEEGALAAFPFLADPMGVLSRRWRWMALAGVVGILATAMLVAGWKPRYVAEATVLITSQQIPEEFVRSTVREDSLYNINAMLGKVLSQINLSRIIDQYELYPELRAKMPLSDVITLMRSNVGAAPVGAYASNEESLVYGISFEDRSSDTAATVANALAAVFVETSVARRNDQARRTTEFLREELKRDERDLREYGERITEFRTGHRGELPGEMVMKLGKLDRLSERRRSTEAQMAEAENRIAMLSSLPPPEREKSANELLLEELSRMLARELAVNTEAHPNVTSLRRQVDEQRSVVEAERRDRPNVNYETAALINAARREIATSRSQLADFDEQIAVLNATVDRMPAVEEEMKTLEQKEKVLRDDYLESLRKVEQAELAESLEAAQQGAQVSILDPAVRPTSPKRSRARIALLGVMGSLVIFVGAAVLLEVFDPVVLRAEQLERIAERPVLGTLAKVA